MGNNTTGRILPSQSSLYFVRRKNTQQGDMDTTDSSYLTTCSYHVLDMVRATRSISKHSHPHFSITDATVISPLSATSCIFACHLATSRMSLLSYVDDCCFPALHSRTSQAPFETLSASLNTEMRLLETNSLLGCKRLSSASESTLTVLRKSLRKGTILHKSSEPC
jgi:hypothetical protein